MDAHPHVLTTNTYRNLVIFVRQRQYIPVVFEQHKGLGGGDFGELPMLCAEDDRRGDRCVRVHLRRVKLTEPQSCVEHRGDVVPDLSLGQRTLLYRIHLVKELVLEFRTSFGSHKICYTN